MRCKYAHLGSEELPAAAGQLGLEGQNGNVSRWSKIADRARGKVISSRNRLLGHVG